MHCGRCYAGSADVENFKKLKAVYYKAVSFRGHGFLSYIFYLLIVEKSNIIEEKIF